MAQAAIVARQDIFTQVDGNCAGTPATKVMTPLYAVLSSIKLIKLYDYTSYACRSSTKSRLFTLWADVIMYLDKRKLT
ncbi:MAG: hypothetical protein RR295_10750, partial [Oscillospiraceae bacterium]